jgi:AraC-like DNA-binding protein
MTSAARDKHEETLVMLRTLEEVRPLHEALAREYLRAWGLRCILADTHGQGVHDAACVPGCEVGPECAAVRRRAIRESVRWGEPTVLLCPSGAMIWAVPVMENAVLIGGLIAAEAVPGDSGRASLSPSEIHQAAQDLLARAEEANLTNAALLELRRAAARRESERAEAIHAVKDQDYHSIRDLYLVEEPNLISAIKRGDRATAREIINRVLVGIYFVGRDRPLLLKSFLLELVVMMSRSAVEAGGDPSELLGANYSSFAELAGIEGEEPLCAWLVAMLERIMDAIHTHHNYPISVLLGAAIRYMEEHLSEEISRDDAAKVACLSPTHFSRVIKQTFGQSFTDLLAKMRIDKAREMLYLTEKSIIQISLDCGFSDQSYFTKVFKKHTGQTPGEYRRGRR